MIDHMLKKHIPSSIIVKTLKKKKYILGNKMNSNKGYVAGVFFNVSIKLDSCVSKNHKKT